MIKITNANIITDNGILENHTAIFSDKLVAIGKNETLADIPATETLDAKHFYLSPGFIDVHVHGCNAFDTMDDDEAAIEKISAALVQTGVTAFLPTTMTMEMSHIHRSLTRIRAAMTTATGAAVLGCHLEGPFINKQYKGAQDDAHILRPDFALIRPYADIIKIITLAPETADGPAFIQQCRKQQMAVSIGHSAATYDQAMAAMAAGACHITHMFNALPPFHHRHPGVIGAAFDSGVNCELIADNIHVHPAMQRLLITDKGADKVVLVTDAMRACLLQDGIYDLGGQQVVVQNGKATLLSGVIAGSVLTMNQAIANVRRNTALALPAIIKMATANPAKVLGVEQYKGSIAEGKDADLVICNDEMTIMTTFVGGKQVYRREGF